MANVVVIENDPKLEREILGYLKELDEAVETRVYPSSKAFESRYFKEQEKSLASEAPKPAEFSSLTKACNEDQLTWLSQKALKTDQMALGPSGATLILGLKDGVMQSHSSKEKNHLIDSQEMSADPFKEKLNPTAQPLWTKFIEEVTSIGRGSAIIPFSFSETHLWLVQAVGITKDATIEVKLKDITTQQKALFENFVKQAKSKSSVKDWINFKTIHMIIARGACVEGDIKDWAQKTQKALRGAKMWPDENLPTRMVLTRYENDTTEKAKLSHPFIDDLMVVPFDRLLFLQKLEVVTNLPKKITPSFLFNQETDMEVEVSKKTSIELLSDVGFAIRNPVALQNGIFGHFYFKLPTSKDMLQIYGKVIASLPHPSEPGQFLVYFAFIAPERSTLMKIRTFLTAGSTFRQLKSEDPSLFQYNPDNIFLTDAQRRRKVIAVIDADLDQLKLTSERIQRDMGQVQVIKSSSYARFLTKYLDAASNPKNVPASTEADFFEAKVVFSFNRANQDLHRFHHPIREGLKVLDHEVKSLFEKSRTWQQLFGVKESKEQLEELIAMVNTHGQHRNLFELTAADGLLKVVAVQMQRLDDNIYQVELSPPTPEEMQLTQVDVGLESLDMLVIDEKLVPTDVEAWLNGLNELAKRRNLCNQYPEVNVMVLTSSEKSSTYKRFLPHRRIRSICLKPVETRSLLFQVSKILDVNYTLYCFENINWKEQKISCYLAKEARLKVLSEFGASIWHPKPIAAGTLLYLHGGIYEKAPDGNLCARFYNCEANDGDEGGFLCHALYYGISDSFLKYTRSWIRDNYASLKAQQG